MAKITYDEHPSVAYWRSMAANLEKNTGRNLDKWVALVRKQKLTDEKAIRAWLKKEHGVGMSTAGVIADGLNPDSVFYGVWDAQAIGEQNVAAMFKGKEHLLPIYEAALKLARSLGKDVKVSPCGTIVPIFRKHVIAQLKPATKTRVDLSLALGEQRTPARLVDTGGAAKGDRLTRRIALEKVADVDAEVQEWLRVAYAGDAWSSCHG